MAKLESSKGSLSTKSTGLFTVKNNWQTERCYSSKIDQYLPEIKEKYGFPSHVISYIANYLNDREAIYLIFRKLLFWQTEGLKGYDLIPKA